MKLSYRVLTLAIFCAGVAGTASATDGSRPSFFERARSVVTGSAHMPDQKSEKRYVIYADQGGESNAPVARIMDSLSGIMPLTPDQASWMASLALESSASPWSIGTDDGFEWTYRHLPSAQARVNEMLLGFKTLGADGDAYIRAALWCPMASTESGLPDHHRLTLLSACREVASSIAAKGFDRAPAIDALSSLSAAELETAWTRGAQASDSLVLITHEVAPE